MMRIIIAGNGIIVYFLAKRFISKGYQVSIISSDETDCDYYTRNLKALVIQGTSTDPELLRQAGALFAEIFIAMTDRDQDNLVFCQLARTWFQIPHILAVVNDPDNEEVFSRLGIRAISSGRFLLEAVESMSALETIKQQFSVVEGRITLTELEISPASAAVGKALREITLPGSVLVASILRGDEVIIPRGDTRIEAGDRILVISLPDNQAVALQILS